MKAHKGCHVDHAWYTRDLKKKKTFQKNLSLKYLTAKNSSADIKSCNTAQTDEVSFDGLHSFFSHTDGKSDTL